MTQDADEPRDDPDDLRADAYDVAVVGGGAPGLSAAVALLRFGRSVVVIDDATPRNAAVGHVHNMLTHDGTSPAELYQLEQIEVESYGGRLITGTVCSIHGSTFAFTMRLDDQAIPAHRIIVATGGRDELPDVLGLTPRWGKDVVHCAFCHG